MSSINRFSKESNKIISTTVTGKVSKFKSVPEKSKYLFRETLKLLMQNTN